MVYDPCYKDPYIRYPGCWDQEKKDKDKKEKKEDKDDGPFGCAGSPTP